MGSLRNPVGPLPSTIYWRRRAALLAFFVLLAVLVIWAVAASGGGSDDTGADGPGKGGHSPASSITPGPSGTGPAISQHPGGRDESDSGGNGGDDGDGGTGGGSGGDGDEGGVAGSGGGTGSGTGGGDRLPAGSPLTNCAADAVQLTLRSVKNRYAPGETPELELTAKNNSGKDCKVDLGGKRTVMTIAKADGDVEIWSSEDCPRNDASYLLRVPSKGSATRTVEWDRRPSAPECATPEEGAAAPGTYFVEAKAPGGEKAQTSFVLKAD